MQFLKFFPSLWTFIFAITFGFQIFRGEGIDAIIFGVATLIMLSQKIPALQNITLPRVTLSKRTIWFLASFAGLALAYIPRHHPLLAFALIALAVLLFATLWGREEGRVRLSSTEFRSSIFWSITALVVALWELAALVTANIKKNDRAYPTISELVVPALDSPLARIQFVTGWILIGWLVIRHWRHR